MAVNFIKCEGICTIKGPYGLRSGRSIPVRRVPNTERFADFCNIKFQDCFS